MNKTFPTLILGIVLALLVYFFNEQTQQIRLGLSILAFIAVLWMTETFHVSVTAMLVPLLAIATGLMDVKQAFINFAHPVIFLFMGGFALAAALHQQKIDQRIAQWICFVARGRAHVAVWMIFGATAFISMWISNTATTAMMLPMALGLLSGTHYESNKSLYWYVLLGVAYSANVGGMGTLVGSPPNAIAAANTGIGFAQWLRFGIPIVVITLPIIVLLLHWKFRPKLDFSFAVVERHTPFTFRQKLTLLVFLVTVMGWLFSSQLASLLHIESQFDSVVAMFALVTLAALGLMDWKEFQGSTNWGVLILFGGGLTLSQLLQATGSSLYLSEWMIGHLLQAPTLLFLLALTLFVVFLTEVASNTASSALLIPIFIGVAPSFGISDQLIAILIALAASCAFMLPVATPPNAIVFGTGLLPQQQMLRTGIYLNLIMTLVIASVIYFLTGSGS
jgi:sodium-dependent dicarboxylate transporter 2/3/5